MQTTDIHRKISLLQQYVFTLEKQNYAKNTQTSLLYSQIKSLQSQNKFLKSLIQTMKSKWDQQRKQLNEKIQNKSDQIVLKSRNFQQQLRNSIDMTSMKVVAQDMRQQLQTKQQQITQLTQKNQSLQKQLDKIKSQVTQITYRSLRSQEKLRNQLTVVKQLENQIYKLKNNKIGSKNGVSFAKLQVEKLVRQNNQLIEKIRYLQKQKNDYYQQLKMTSPLKTKQANRQNRSTKKKGSGNGKSQKWNQIQQKLKAIRTQNEQLKYNLTII